MDRTKTGALIAAARKEQNMTQKELAAWMRAHKDLYPHYTLG